MKVCTSTLLAACLASTALAWPMRQATQAPSDQEDKYQTEKQDAAMLNALVNHMKAGPGLNATAPAGNTTTTSASEGKPAGGTFKETTPNSNATTLQVQPYNSTADPAGVANPQQQKGHDAKEQYANGMVGKMAAEAPHVHKEMMSGAPTLETKALQDASDEQCDCKKEERRDGGDMDMMDESNMDADMNPETETSKPMTDIMGEQEQNDMDKRMDFPQGMDSDMPEDADDAPILEKRIEHSDAENKMTGNHDIAHQMASMSDSHGAKSKPSSPSNSSSSTSSTTQQQEKQASTPTTPDDKMASSAAAAEALPRVMLTAPSSKKPLSKREIGMLERFASYVRDLMDAGDGTSVKPSNSSGGGMASRAVASNNSNSTVTAEDERSEKMAEIREAISEKMAQGQNMQKGGEQKEEKSKMERRDMSKDGKMMMTEGGKDAMSEGKAMDSEAMHETRDMKPDEKASSDAMDMESGMADKHTPMPMHMPNDKMSQTHGMDEKMMPEAMDMHME